jgi:hypothetical protein
MEKCSCPGLSCDYVIALHSAPQNLPYRFGDHELRQLFSPFGTVTMCRVLHQGDTTGQGGAALVRLSSMDDATAAVQALQGHRVLGALHPLIIRFADSAEIKAKKQAKQSTGQPLQAGSSSFVSQAPLQQSQVHHHHHHESAGQRYGPYGSPSMFALPHSVSPSYSQQQLHVGVGGNGSSTNRASIPPYYQPSAGQQSMISPGGPSFMSASVPGLDPALYVSSEYRGGGVGKL